MAKGAYIGVEKTTYLNSLGDVEVGSTVKINENGSPVEFFVATHDYESELNGSGRTLLVRKTLPTERVAWSNAANQYVAGTPLNVWLNDTYKTRLDSAVQDAISTTRIKSCSGGGSSEITVRSFSIFALSVTELGLSGGDVPVEGSKLPIADTLRSLNDYNQSSGSNLQEWTRTPEKNGTQYAFYEYSGSVYQQTVPTYYNVRPCFTLPASLGVGDDNLITGAQAESVTQPVARKIKKGYVGIETSRYLNSIGDIAVGDTVKINENGSPVDYIVVHQGNPDSSMYDASCDGTWVLRKDIYVKSIWDDTNNDYANSDVYTYLNGAFLSVLDSNVQSTIKQVKIPYVNGTASSGSVATSASGLSTKAFLLSAYEVGYTTSNDSYIPQDGAVLSYFNVASNLSTLLKASYNGTTSAWYLRSCYKRVNYNTSVYAVNINGVVTDFYISENYGIRPAFILPSNLSLSNNVVTGAQAESITQSLARKIKKAYIGIGGVARPCWSGGELAYYGTITPLSKARYALAATSIGDYALFGGGRDSSSGVNNVDAYNKSLTVSNLTMELPSHSLAATTVGNYALFGGGLLSGSYGSVRSYVAPFNSVLTLGAAISLGLARAHPAATTIGNYALFCGGMNNSSVISNYVDTVDVSLVKGTATVLSVPKYQFAATSVGDYALFGGGYTTGNVRSAVVDSYNKSLTRSTPTALNVAATHLAATTVGDYALFGGGAETDPTSVVTAYNKSLTRSTPTALSIPMHQVSATTVGDYALFGGGVTTGYGKTKVVNAYDASLTRTIPTELNTARAVLAATSVGDYALFGGGNSGSPSAVVDAYTVA